MQRRYSRYGAKRHGNSRGYGGGRQTAPARGIGRRNKIKYMQVDPRMLIKKAVVREVDSFTPTHAFTDLSINPTIKQNILDKGYQTPTPIQDQVIPQVLEARDVIGLASTGTGKTAAFLIPLINKVAENRSERVLIIVPTRELAVQIIDEGKALGRGMGVFFALVIGGVDMRRQVRELSRDPAFVVGTPGRLKDLAERGYLRLSHYRTIVLDEVDRMLDMGFVNDMRTLISQLPKERHSLFFSATMSDKARQVASEFLHDPVVVQIAAQRASDNVDQDVVRLNGRNKIDVLHDLLIRPGFTKVLVFGRTKHGMEKLSRSLSDRGFATASIHGNKSQSQRQRALQSFKRSEIQVLLATDVASRGIDIDEVTHVINYELPETYEDYIHRIGRTGRADKTGLALTFIE